MHWSAARLVALVGTVALHGSALAVPFITTATLPSGSASVARCYVVNAGTRDADVTVEIVNAIGVSQGSNSGTLAPGLVMVFTDNTPADSYCRVSGISAGKARLSFCMTTAAGNCLELATAP